MNETEIQAAVAHFEALRIIIFINRLDHAGQLMADHSGIGYQSVCPAERADVRAADPGDGIGPIIMRQAERVLRTLLAPAIAAGRVRLLPIPGLTIENRLARGQSVPDETLAAILACDVLLKGPTTTAKGGSLESANVTLRRVLDLYANVRPVIVPDEGIDWTFFRENTEGEYALGSLGV